MWELTFRTWTNLPRAIGLLFRNAFVATDQSDCRQPYSLALLKVDPLKAYNLFGAPPRVNVREDGFRTPNLLEKMGQTPSEHGAAPCIPNSHMTEVAHFVQISWWGQTYKQYIQSQTALKKTKFYPFTEADRQIACGTVFSFVPLLWP